MSAPAEQETKTECATSNDLRRTARGYYSAGTVRYDALGARLEVLADALDALAAAVPNVEALAQVFEIARSDTTFSQRTQFSAIEPLTGAPRP